MIGVGAARDDGDDLPIGRLFRFGHGGGHAVVIGFVHDQAHHQSPEAPPPPKLPPPPEKPPPPPQPPPPQPDPPPPPHPRPEARRVGNEGVSPCRAEWARGI